MRIFVTGATGVIGRRVVPCLVAAGHKVTAVGRSFEKRRVLAETGATPVQVDLFDPQGLATAIDGHEAVVNLATHVPATMGAMMKPGAWRENDRLRREASAHLATTAKEVGASRFIQESFVGIYAGKGDEWVTEGDPIETLSFSESMRDAEQAAGGFTGPGRNGVVLRFGAFYAADSPQVREMMRMVRWGLSPLPGPAAHYYTALHLDDAASAVVAALGVPAGIYNVAEDEPVRRRVFVDALADTMRVRHPTFLPTWTTRLMGQPSQIMARSIRLSNRKFREASGWTPAYPSVLEGWPAVVQRVAQEAGKAPA